MTNFSSSQQSKTSGNAQNNVVVMLAIGAVLGFVLGHLWTKADMLEKGTAGTAGVNNGAVAGAQDTNAAPERPTSLDVPKPDSKDDNWLGDTGARYVMVEYSDFECPFCQSFIPTLEEIKTSYPEMAIVYRHFPLSFHPMAQPSAEMSECVADLGGNEAFWKFHDLMFEKMPNLTKDQLASVAGEAGVDANAAQKCFDEGRFKDRVNTQFSEGSAAGVAATPTSVIYDTETGETAVIEGALPFAQAQSIIDGFIK